jgi:hypothetical protein
LLNGRHLCFLYNPLKIRTAKVFKIGRMQNIDEKKFWMEIDGKTILCGDFCKKGVIKDREHCKRRGYSLIKEILWFVLKL